MEGEGRLEFVPRVGVEAAPQLGHIKFADLRSMALDELVWIMQHAGRAATRLNALREVLSRTDPEPKPTLEPQQVLIAVNVALGNATKGNQPRPELPAGSLEVHLARNGGEQHE